MKLLRWTHVHTFTVGAIGGVAVTQRPWLIGGLVAGALVLGFVTGRLAYRAKGLALMAERRLGAAESLAAEKVKQARAVTARRRAEARVAAAKAVDAKALAAGERHRAERARGVTNSEIAELQMGRP